MRQGAFVMAVHDLMACSKCWRVWDTEDITICVNADDLILGQLCPDCLSGWFEFVHENKEKGDL